MYITSGYDLSSVYEKKANVSYINNMDD